MSEEVKSSEEQVEVLIDPETIVPQVEALLFVSGSPVAASKLASVLQFKKEVVLEALAVIVERYQSEAFGFELIEVGTGFQLRSKPAHQEVITKLKSSRPKKLSQQALETLAVVSYRQPIVKSDIEAIRGVDATPTIKTLMERRLIRIVGHQASVGQPALYGTTEKFLEVFGLKSLAELPTLRELAELEEDPGEEDEFDMEGSSPLEPNSELIDEESSVQPSPPVES